MLRAVEILKETPTVSLAAEKPPRDTGGPVPRLSPAGGFPVSGPKFDARVKQEVRLEAAALPQARAGLATAVGRGRGGGSLQPNCLRNFQFSYYSMRRSAFLLRPTSVYNMLHATPCSGSLVGQSWVERES